MLSCFKDFAKKCRRHEQRNYLKGNPIMGMAASQARLLSITARLTNNENTGQAISYSKQRLADQTQQITNEYNEALDATKLTVLTGFNGAQANYEDISYNLMTGMRMAETTKQYVVTDTKGKVLVTNEIARAYEKSKGDFNSFLAKLGYSQSDMIVQDTDEYTDAQKDVAGQKIHEAWDKYFATVGINLGDYEHDTFRDKFQWNNTWATVVDKNGDLKYADKDGNVIEVPSDVTGREAIENYLKANGGISQVGDGYTSYKDENGNWQPINYEGTTEESRNLYEYAMSITEAFLRTTNDATNKPYIMTGSDAIKSAADPDNASAIKYYQNIFNKIQSSGYFTYTNTPAEIDENHLYTSEGTGTKGNVKKNPLQDNYTFEAALRDGSLRLEYYSSTDKAFKSTTISEDNCIQEVADERAIARAETKYTQDMADLENKDKKLDLELKKLDTEHSALQTEYDAVKNVVDKNVESSFKIFS